MLRQVLPNSVDKIRCTPGEIARNICLEFDSEHACSTALEHLRNQKLVFHCEMQDEDMVIRSRPDKTLPMRLRGSAVGAIFKVALPALEARPKWNAASFKLGGSPKRGLLYARNEKAMYPLFRICEQGDGTSFTFEPESKGMEFFGITPEEAAQLVEKAKENAQR